MFYPEIEKNNIRHFLPDFFYDIFGFFLIFRYFYKNEVIKCVHKCKTKYVRFLLIKVFQIIFHWIGNSVGQWQT